jgi:uncharacterized membrane protein YidH (DUF202 family)
MSQVDPRAPVFATERTALAWTRSALSVAAIGALIVRAATQSHLAVVGYPVGIALLLLAAAVWARGNTGYRRNVAPVDDAPVVPATVPLRVIAGVTVAIAAFALLFALVIVL